MEIADLKHALHGTEVEVKLLEERMEVAEGSIDSARESTDLNRKIVVLEKNLDKLASELRALTHFSTQTTAALSSYRQQIGAIDSKLDEIAKLRSTLTELSRAELSRSASSVETSSYQVKPGDSLEKIARKYQISVDALKRENNLSSDKIVVGQQLAIPTK